MRPVFVCHADFIVCLIHSLLQASNHAYEGEDKWYQETH